MSNPLGGLMALLSPSPSATPSKGLLGDPQSQMMLGASLLAAGGPSLTPKSGFEGIPQTMALMQRQQMLKQEQERQNHEREAQKGWIQNNLGAEYLGAPDAAISAALSNKYAAPKSYTPKMEMINGVPHWINEQTQQITAADGFAQPTGVSEDVRKTETDLRAEIAPKRKLYDQAQQGYNKVLAAATDGTGASDVALVFGYMKTLDPTSTVREGEVATVQQVGGAAQKMIGLYNNLINGQTLTPEQRREIASAAANQFNVVRTQFGQSQDYMRELATQYGASPERILQPLGEFNPPPNVSAADLATIKFTQAGQ